MTTETNTTVGPRVLTAFFDNPEAATKAITDLVAAGIPHRHITQSGRDTTEAGHPGVWESLRHLFLPEDDHHSYAEGLRRGGSLLTVETEEGNYTRVLTILDNDGAVDMDTRESLWRSEGWQGRTPTAVMARMSNSSPLPVSVPPPASAPVSPALATPVRETVDNSWRNDDLARAAALDGSVPATAMAAARALRRDDAQGRTRLRSYVVDDAEIGEAPRGSFQADRDATKIVPHMPVISSDGQTIGTVDHLDGPDRIKLAKTTSPDGEHHLVPFDWIDHVDEHVHLTLSLAAIKTRTSATKR